MPAHRVPRGRRARVTAATAFITLVAGYADLVHGGITVGPVLLVLAHLVLVPAALCLA